MRYALQWSDMDTVIIREPMEDVNRGDVLDWCGDLYIVTDVDTDDDRGYTIYTARPVEPIEIEEADAADDEWPEDWQSNDRREE